MSTEDVKSSGNRREREKENYERRMRKIEGSIRKVKERLREVINSLEEVEEELEEVKTAWKIERRENEVLREELKVEKEKIIEKENEIRELKSELVVIRREAEALTEPEAEGESESEGDIKKLKSVIVEMGKDETRMNEKLGQKRKRQETSEEEEGDDGISVWGDQDETGQDREEKQEKEDKREWITKDRGLVMVQARNWKVGDCVEDWLEKTLDVKAPGNFKVKSCNAEGVVLVYFKDQVIRSRLWSLKRSLGEGEIVKLDRILDREEREDRRLIIREIRRIKELYAVIGIRDVRAKAFHDGAWINEKWFKMRNGKLVEDRNRNRERRGE